MKLNRVSAAVAGSAVAGVAVLSGFGIAHHQAGTAAHSAGAVSSTVHRVSDSPTARSASAINLPQESSHRASPQVAAARPASSASAAASAPASSPADPALVWLESAGGQAQVTINDDVDTLASDLETESHSPTVANHLSFEADARVVRAEAQQILADPALLPTVNRAAYVQMLNDYIVVANLLQPGPGYGTTPQDYAAWNAAMAASNINVS